MDVEKLAEAIFKTVEEYHGKRNLKALDLMKIMAEKFGCDKQLCKQAIRILMDSGRCVYNYAGGSYITLPIDK